MTTDDWIFGFVMALLGGILANAIELPIIYRMTRPERLLKRFAHPSEGDRKLLQLFFNNMLDMFLDKTIKTGEKLKVIKKDAVIGADGKEITPAEYSYIDEVVSPLDMFIERMSKDTLNRVQGWMGQMKRDTKKMGTSGWQEMILNILESRIMPKVEDAVAARINTALTPKVPIE